MTRSQGWPHVRQVNVPGSVPGLSLAWCGSCCAVQPFLEPGHPVHAFLPPLELALVAPVWQLLAGVCSVLCSVGWLLIAVPSATASL